MADTTDGIAGHRALPARFALGELVGTGGMADVYRAHDRQLDRPVAIKVFRHDPKGRFDDEVAALARLSHVGLVSIFDIGRHGNRPYLVMQLVTGPSLKSRLEGGPLSVDETIRLGTTLAGALAHAHDRGVVHRDVKPANILLDERGAPHLADLGIALLTGGERRTRTDEVLGTPAYLAPEQVLGTVVGPPVDVYALGLVLLECLTGRTEYDGGNEIAAALARLNRPPRIPAGLPRRLATLLLAMTATDPRRRPTAAQCAATLGGATARLVVPRPHRIPSRTTAVAAVGAAALVGGVVFLLTSNGDPNVPGRDAANQPVSTSVAPPPTTTIDGGRTTVLPPDAGQNGDGNGNGDNGNQAATHRKGGHHH